MRQEMGLRLKQHPHKKFVKDILRNKYIYLLLLPGILFYLLFAYGPMYGIILAFKDYTFKGGILGSPWVGLEKFRMLFVEPEFIQAFKNTIIISFGKIIFGFPIPILLAILLNELRFKKFKKTLQTVFTFPHFLSWIIISSIVLNIFGNLGAVNNMLSVLGLERQHFLADKQLFRPLLYITDIWKEAGWSSIIYLAAISGINPELYEAATIDGANRFQKIRYVTWPGMRSVAELLLLLSIGQVMNAGYGFDQVFNLYNPTVYEVGDIIDTFVYRITFQRPPDFGFSTAVGLFKSVINFGLLVTADRVAKALGQRGIF